MGSSLTKEEKDNLFLGNDMPEPYDDDEKRMHHALTEIIRIQLTTQYEKWEKNGRLARYWRSQNRVLLFGLSGAGKTVIFKKWTNSKSDVMRDLMPEGVTLSSTIGFGCCDIIYSCAEINLADNSSTKPSGLDKPVSITLIDTGELVNERPSWKLFFRKKSDTKNVLLAFVVDASDRESVYEARDMLHMRMKERALRDVPVLVIFNKQDRPDTIPDDDLAANLGLSQLDGCYATCHCSENDMFELKMKTAKIINALMTVKSRINLRKVMESL